ncbi:HAMP domain-containing histidine kinase [Solirubrobacter ginsenosidimutans]|uniref:histidine kinase n=1 Tax=Solirubrobacter ginsenosidimutans TaxID=490573 RepID=A0A9X3N5Q8_9ACTN|nr:HAMP domain-containing sensor histidine kinase [Solirubrobacter ginsenosidimutans]MDA0165368.1 HAMP domain-containing histidine kinase [Solirubrobacter ginsenosidimutans]
MSFRRRLALSCAAAVAVVVVFGSGLAYWIVSDTLHGQVDSSLRDQATLGAVTMAEPGPGTVATGDQLLTTAAAPVYKQVVRISRREALPPALSPDDPDLKAVANGSKPPFFADRQIGGDPWRVYISRGGDGLAIFLARPLNETYHALSTLRLALGLLALAGIVLAVVLSRLATRTAIRPVTTLTEAAEHVASTRDLSRRIETQGEDEVSRLATSFNTMLEALERSQRAQRQLVADASHELRTPLTSLRTNLEVLAKGGPPDAGDRDRLRADLVAQLEELSALVGDLVELARDEEPEEPSVEDVRLDRLVAAAVERARRHAHAVTFATALEPALVLGVPARLDRAVANLLDNAAKWSPAGSVIDVRLRDGELTVRDRGPGIEQQDRDQVFDRFFRSDSARGRPGSGLGLAIVRQVAEGHGGSVAAEAAEGGGALLRLRLPVLSANP